MCIGIGIAWLARPRADRTSQGRARSALGFVVAASVFEQARRRRERGRQLHANPVGRPVTPGLLGWSHERATQENAVIVSRRRLATPDASAAHHRARIPDRRSTTMSERLAPILSDPALSHARRRPERPDHRRRWSDARPVLREGRHLFPSARLDVASDGTRPRHRHSTRHCCRTLGDESRLRDIVVNSALHRAGHTASTRAADTFEPAFDSSNSWTGASCRNRDPSSGAQSLNWKAALTGPGASWPPRLP